MSKRNLFLVMLLIIFILPLCGNSSIEGEWWFDSVYRTEMIQFLEGKVFIDNDGEKIKAGSYRILQDSYGAHLVFWVFEDCFYCNYDEGSLVLEGVGYIVLFNRTRKWVRVDKIPLLFKLEKVDSLDSPLKDK